MRSTNNKKDNHESMEFTGKTVEKALQKALKKLGLEIDEVEIEILDGGQKGVLNIFGARDARIRVARKENTKNIEEIVEEVAKLILGCMDVNFRIFSEKEGDSTYINIETAGVDGLLIGRKGDTLNSLQHLIGRIVARRMGGYQKMTLDVGGYLKNRRDILRQKALKAAEKAKRTKRDIPLEPMKASERRIVHITLTDDEKVSTYTVGNGELRKVYVSPTKSGGSKRNERK
jgi:spoIIIJ-associated protein